MLEVADIIRQHGAAYAYHSCRNRHCPKCHTVQTRRWLDQQQARLFAGQRRRAERRGPAVAPAQAPGLSGAGAGPVYSIPGQVTFRYRDNRTQQMCRVTLTAQEFIRRFLLHLLPRGFPKVRYYGLASASASQKRERACSLLQAQSRLPESANPPSALAAQPAALPLCPRCQKGRLQVLEILRPRRKFPP